jgi:hypothetical protein
MTAEDAMLFKEMCRYNFIDYDSDTIKRRGIAYINIVAEEMISSSVSYGVKAVDVFAMQDINLVTYDTVRHSEFGLASTDENGIVLYYYGKKVVIKKTDSNGDFLKRVSALPVGKMKLTQAGRELARICSPDPSWEYFDYIIGRWQNFGFHVTISDAQVPN